MLHDGNNSFTSTNTWLNSAVVSFFVIAVCFPKYRIVFAKCPPVSWALRAIAGGKIDFQHQMPEIHTSKAVPWGSPTQRTQAQSPIAPKDRSPLWRTRPWPRLQPGSDALGGDSPSSPYSCAAFLQEAWTHIQALFSALGFCATFHSLFFRVTAQCLGITFSGLCFK